MSTKFNSNNINYKFCKIISGHCWTSSPDITMQECMFCGCSKQEHQAVKIKNKKLKIVVDIE